VIGDGVVTGSVMPVPNNEHKFIRIPKSVQSTSSVADRLDACRDDRRIAEEGVEPLPASGLKIDEEFGGICSFSRGRVRRRE
jgi:hypothetical protein